MDVLFGILLILLGLGIYVLFVMAVLMLCSNKCSENCNQGRQCDCGDNND